MTLFRGRPFLWQHKTAKKPPTTADIERLKASRRAALARVASQKQQAEAKKQHAQAKTEEVRRKREAEAAKRADALRSAAAARSSSVAAENRQRKRELELTRQAEVEATRERVAAVLAYDETQADERERQVRNETYARIRREEKRRELALQRQEDERAERMRLYECGEKYICSSTTPSFVPPPAVQSARSFFSITGSTVSEARRKYVAAFFSSVLFTAVCKCIEFCTKVDGADRLHDFTEVCACEIRSTQTCWSALPQHTPSIVVHTGGTFLSWRSLLYGRQLKKQTTCLRSNHTTIENTGEE